MLNSVLTSAAGVSRSHVSYIRIPSWVGIVLRQTSGAEVELEAAGTHVQIRYHVLSSSKNGFVVAFVGVSWEK
jgi:hypothetical protein